MEVKDRIIETAARLFYEQGYNSTGINQIIDEAEVAKASLYQYFPSKEDILVAYLNRAAAETEKGLQRFTSRPRATKQKALAMFDFLLSVIDQSTFNGCNFLNIASEIPQKNTRLNGLIRQQKDSIRRMFAEILRADGKEKLADELYILFDAALISSKVHGNAWPAKAARKVAEKLI